MEDGVGVVDVGGGVVVEGRGEELVEDGLVVDDDEEGWMVELEGRGEEVVGERVDDVERCCWV